jgi:hypothetical protein
MYQDNWHEDKETSYRKTTRKEAGHDRPTVASSGILSGSFSWFSVPQTCEMINDIQS